MNNPKLVLIRGVPGSGKSYLACKLQEALAEKLGTNSVINIDPDGTDYKSPQYLEMSQTLTEQGVDLKFHPYRFIRAQAHSGIKKGQIIVWNQPFTQFDGFEKTIINLTGHAADHGTTLPLLVVEVEIDNVLAKKRVDDRKKAGGHGPSTATFARFINDYVSFSDKKYNTVIVHGSDEATDSVAKIMQALENL